MEFVCDMLCELPFMLNLPSGEYKCVADGADFDLEVLQEHVALHWPDGSFAIEQPRNLKTAFGAHFDTQHKQQLRTLLRHRTKHTVEENELTNPTEEQLRDEMMSSIIKEAPMAFAANTAGLRSEASRRVGALSDAEHCVFRRFVSRKLHVKKTPDFAIFLAGVNSLVRLYMERFNDFFVEEVAVHQLASQAPLQGIYVAITCDGELIHDYGIVGLVPPIMRRPWLDHPAEQVENFRRDLANGVAPEAVALLGIRARAFLVRDAFRSAIIEASAAVDLALARKIREGFRKLGKSDEEIDSMLRQRQNQWFGERAKRIMKESTGVSVAHLDNSLWQRVSAHRTTQRQGVAHADQEPSHEEAREAVEDFCAWAARIAAVVPEIDIQRAAYFRWQGNGRRGGHDLDDWLAAEKELTAASAQRER
jgi:hypothetical protein